MKIAKIDEISYPFYSISFISLERNGVVENQKSMLFWQYFNMSAKELNHINPVHAILDRLEISPSDPIVFFHIKSEAFASWGDWRFVLDSLESYFSKKTTICMPSFPFPRNNYTDYFKTDPLFDVRRTPSRVSVITEIFRRDPRCARSMNPFLPVAARGPLAEFITSEHHLNPSPFSEVSPLNKILNLKGKVVGLGFDCNTNAFIHLIDEQLKNSYPFKLYEESAFMLRLIDRQSQESRITSQLLTSEITKKIKPRKLKPHLLTEPFYKEHRLNETHSFSLKTPEFVKFGNSITQRFLKTTGFPLHYES